MGVGVLDVSPCSAWLSVCSLLWRRVAIARCVLCALFFEPDCARDKWEDAKARERMGAE